ncbi:response regulator [Nonomuraea zeae]|uniref:Response regulator transcription factor n=1 Tax=Nonomuraea zeae TaxID=1642303 RepID=A0A5S4G529_9ACTN|nr:response regulator transcription factor [Nonomuraea zeae]TMR27521.1 response regulator transcription factor [Nonomuraea zeae]
MTVAIRVLLVDDQELVRTGIQLVLRREPDITVVGEAGDGGQALKVLAEVETDVVVMDVRMPGMDGLEATARICAENGPKVLVLTTFDLDDYVFGALKAGASGFLLKDVGPQAFVEAIKLVHRGESVLAPSATRLLISHFVSHRPRRCADVALQRAELLSRREREVLAMIAAGLSNAEIAARMFVSDGTVRTHVSHILAKLELRDRVQAVIFAYENGLIEPT